MDGYRFTVERNKLCIWLEREQERLQGLPQAERESKRLELERLFRIKLDALYAQASPQLKVPEDLQ